MGQERFWNWKDDDNTFRLNWRTLILVPYGRYAGFGYDQSSAILNLVLSHTADNKTKMKADNTPSDPMGVWKTRHGVIVTEDANLSLTLTPGDITNPRIDILVGQHDYILTTGGATAQYTIIQGTPSANPVAPILANNQILIATIEIPTNFSDILDTGFSYTPSNIPHFAGNTSGDFGELDNVTLTNEAVGHIALLTGANQWTNVNLKETIQNYNIKMVSTIEEGSRTYDDFNGIPFVALAGGGTGLTLNPSGAGNLLFIDLPPNSYNAEVSALSEAFQKGTKLRFYFKRGSFSFIHNATNSPVGWLPLKLANYNDISEPSLLFTPDKIINLERMDDHWRVSYSTVRADYANDLTFNTTTKQIELRNALGAVLKSIDTTQGLKSTFGQVYTSNRRSSPINGWENAFNGFNTAFVYPPIGYAIQNLIGFIPSIAEVYFDGDVNSGDTLFCNHIIDLPNNRVRVWCNNSNNRAESRINFLALWR